MKSPISFIGKCFTVLIGAALSWATVTNPNVDQIASLLCGHRAKPAVDSTVAAAQVSAMPKPAVRTQQNLLASNLRAHRQPVPNEQSQFVGLRTTERTSSQPQNEQIQAISNQLKQLGASYLLLEKLPQNGKTRYRARCDLGRPQQTVNCCFEAIGDSPVHAMQEILQVVKLNVVPGKISKDDSSRRIPAAT